MTSHVSVGLAATGTPEAPAKAIRLSLANCITCTDTDALLAIEDARMIAAMLITAADELQKQVPK
jgi:hypothetical protein